MAGKRRLSDAQRKEHNQDNQRRYREKHRDDISSYKHHYRAKSSAQATNSGDEWTTAETEIICADRRPRDRQLASDLGRSITAIQVQRNRVKEQPREDT